MKKILFLSFVGSTLFFAGCNSTNSINIVPDKIGSPNVDYTEGYKEGCSTGYNTYLRNQKLYDFNADYRYGWNKGFDDCLKKSTQQR